MTTDHLHSSTLMPQRPNFDDDSPRTPFRAKFPDALPPRFEPVWKKISSWYFGSPQPLYFDMVHARKFQLQRFKIIIQPDLSETILHSINTLRLTAYDANERNTLVSFWIILCHHGIDPDQYYLAPPTLLSVIAPGPIGSQDLTAPASGLRLSTTSESRQLVTLIEHWSFKFRRWRTLFTESPKYITSRFSTIPAIPCSPVQA